MKNCPSCKSIQTERIHRTAVSAPALEGSGSIPSSATNAAAVSTPETRLPPTTRTTLGPVIPDPPARASPAAISSKLEIHDSHPRMAPHRR